MLEKWVKSRKIGLNWYVIQMKVYLPYKKLITVLLKIRKLEYINKKYNNKYYKDENWEKYKKFINMKKFVFLLK